MNLFYSVYDLKLNVSFKSLSKINTKLQENSVPHRYWKLKKSNVVGVGVVIFISIQNIQLNLKDS